MSEMNGNDFLNDVLEIGEEEVQENGGADVEVAVETQEDPTDEPSVEPETPVEEQPSQQTGGLLGGRKTKQSVSRGEQTDADIVLVMDVTGSMDLMINRVKDFALKFNERLQEALKSHQRMPRKLRIKVIGFRDFYYDIQPHPPIQESEFFTIRGNEDEAEDQQELQRFRDFVSTLEPVGGEDDPESALEALHLAFKSDWSEDPTVTKRRHIVVLFTDEDAHPLDDSRRDNPQQNPGNNYPEDAPRSISKLYEEFLAMSGRSGDNMARRLMIFAPKTECWSEIENWDNVVHIIPTKKNCQSVNGDSEIMYDFDDTTLFDYLGGSI